MSGTRPFIISKVGDMIFCLPLFLAKRENSCAVCDSDLRSLTSSSVSKGNFDRGGKWTFECGMTSGKLTLHLTVSLDKVFMPKETRQTIKARQPRSGWWNDAVHISLTLTIILTFFFPSLTAVGLRWFMCFRFQTMFCFCFFNYGSAPKMVSALRC